MVRVHLLSNTEKGPLSGGKLQDVIQANRKTIGLALLA